MANQLKMAMIESILSLWRRGWSKRRIARELGLDRGTVCRQIRLACPSSKPAKVHTGSEPGPTDSKPGTPDAHRLDKGKNRSKSDGPDSEVASDSVTN